MKYLIVSGGYIEDNIIEDTISQYSFDYIIAADKGIEAANKAGIIPDLIVGDFDSADNESVDYYKDKSNIIRLDTHKDDTDTEHALNYAISHEADFIIIIGATGTRYDHSIANICLLKKCADKGIEAYIIDKHNKIYIINKSHRIYKSNYDYISFLPLCNSVSNITLDGFEYSGEDISLVSGTSLGVSNRIINEYGDIRFNKGYLIVFETID